MAKTMKKIILILAAFGILIASSCSNEVRKESTTDTTMTDTTKVADTTTVPPDTMRQN